MERTSALLRGFLVFCSMVAFTTAGTASNYVEDFTTTHYRDRLNTTAEWDSVAGALRLPPLQLTLAGNCGTPGAAYGVAVDGNYVYVADNTSGLQVIDITNPASPVIAGHCATPGRAYGVAISGNHAYVADGTSHRLEVIDITNSASPTLVGSCLTPGIADAVAVDCDFAYVADAFSGLLVISIANPASPSLAGYCSLPDNASGVALSGDYAYLSDGTGGLAVVNIADPAHPTLAGSCLTTGAATNVAISGDDAYVTTTSRDLQIISIADPAHPTLAGSLGTSGEAYGLAVDGDWAYVTDVHVGLLAIDIADPAHPSIVNQYSMVNAQRVALDGDHAYVGAYGAGLQVIRVADPIALTPVAACETPDQTVFLAISGDYVCQIDCSTSILLPSHLRVTDIKDPLNPTSVGSCQLPGWFVYRVVIAGDYAYVAAESYPQGFLEVVSIADPANPTLVGSCATPAPAHDVAISGDFAYVAQADSCVQAVDISDPIHPVLAGRCPIPSASSWFSGIAVSGDHAYVTGQIDFCVIDITDPVHPTFTGSCALPDSPFNLAISGNHAYVADGAWGGLQVVDITNPSAPAVVGSYPFYPNGTAMGIAISGDRAYVAGGNGGLREVDITDPTHPTPVDACALSDWAGNSVVASGDYAYVAQRSAGLQVVEVSQRGVDIQANVGRSLRLNIPGDPIDQVSLSAMQSDSIRWEVTADGGTNWQSVLPDGSWNVLAHPGMDLRWKSTHYYLGRGVNPACTHLNIEYISTVGACCYPGGICQVTIHSACTGNWTVAGVCDPNPCGTTGVDGGELDSVLGVRVKPNPFAGNVSLRVGGPNATPARVLIFDAGGRLVRTAWSGMLNGRAFTVTWDGRDDAGREAANGIYTVRLESGSGHAIGRLVRLR